jgi:hypothetical protein
MTLSAPPWAEVYLVQNRLNPISTRAALELTDDNLRCTVKEYSKWVEKALGISDLRSRLQAGEAVAAFDFRRDQLKIKWLKQFLNAGFSVSEGGSRRWLVSLVYPTGILALVEVVDGWDVHNEWRRALPPTWPAGSETNHGPGSTASTVAWWSSSMHYGLVRAGLSDEFRSAFADAKVIISRMPGFQLLTMR